MNVNEKQKECRLVVKVKIPSKMIVNAKELDRFSRMYLRGFMKPNLVKKNLMEYKGPVGISLQKRLLKPISGRDLLLLLEHIIIAAQKVRANNMRFHYLVMNIQNVYINEETKEVQFIYFPVDGYTTTTSLVALVKIVVASAKAENEQGTYIINGLSQFLKALDPFNVDKLEEYIMSVDRSVVDSLKKQNAGQSGFMTNKQQHYYEYYEKKQIQNDEEATGLLDEEATGVLDEYAMSGVNDESPGLLNEYAMNGVDDEATGLLNEYAMSGVDGESIGVLNEYVMREFDDEATGLLNDNQEITTLRTSVPPMVDEPEQETTFLVMDEEEGTTLLRPDELPVEAPLYPNLYRTSTREDISVNKPVFRLGKEKSYVDYFVTNNPAVSRSHADIIARNNRYFIKDLNSKNRTYINSRPIEVQTEVELYDGDRIRLGNEEFIFRK